MIIALLRGTSSTGGISASSLCRSADFEVFFKVPLISANTNVQLQEEMQTDYEVSIRYIFEKRSLLLSIDITLF